MTPTRSSDLELLARLHADQLEHSGGSLLDHLRGTAALLERWGCPAPLVRAGLFHSVYGTEAFEAFDADAAAAAAADIDAAERAALRAHLGDATEALVYLFCAATRTSLHAGALVDRRTGQRLAADEATLASLACLSAANWLEQRPRLSPALARARVAEYRGVLPRLPAAARAALTAGLRLAMDSDPARDPSADATTHPRSLVELFAFDDAAGLAAVDASCGALDVRYLGAISSRLRARVSPAHLARLDALGDAAYLALLRSPATCQRVLSASHADGDPDDLETFLEGALQIEEWKSGARRRLERDAWSAGGELYLPASTDAAPAALLASLATTTARSGAFDPARPYLAPTLGGWVTVDLHGPETHKPLQQLVYKRLPFGPAEPFTDEERAAVLTKLGAAFSGIVRTSAALARFLRYTLTTVIPRKQTQPHLYPNSFKGSSTAATIHRANVYNLQFPNVDAARLAQSLVHETVHNHLYKRELYCPTLVDDRAGEALRVASPWSGNTLDLYVFAHSSTVYYALHRFFTAALARGTAELPAETCAWFVSRAVAGFASPGWTAILDEHRQLFAPAMGRDLLAMRDTVLASAAALAVEAA